MLRNECYVNYTVSLRRTRLNGQSLYKLTACMYCETFKTKLFFNDKTVKTQLIQRIDLTH